LTQQHLKQVFFAQIENTLDQHHEARADEDWAYEPHVSEGVKDVFVRLAGSQHGDDGAHGKQHSAQHEVRVGSAVALSEPRVFICVEVYRVQLAQSLTQEGRLKNCSHCSRFAPLSAK